MEYNADNVLYDFLQLCHYFVQMPKNCIIENANTSPPDYFFKQIKIINLKQNHGFSAGNNLGYEQASGTYLMFMNNDIIIKRPDWLNNMTDVLDSHPVIGATGQMSNIDFKISQGFQYIQATYMPHCMIPVSWISGYCLMIKREAFEKAGRWRSDLYGLAGYEDIHLGYAVNKAGYLCVSPDRWIFIDHLIGMTQKKLFSENRKPDISSETKLQRFESYFGERDYKISVL